MILINKTYSEITPSSAEYGEHSDTGFIWENAPCTFRELVSYMEEHYEASCYPARGSRYEWYSSGYETIDYATLTERQTSIHYSRQNPGYKEKYWRKAAIAAGIVK